MNFSPSKNAYNPRLGIAYQATDKTVIRAGYGRSFDIGVFGSIFGHVATQNLPVLANQSLGNFGNNSLLSAFNLAQGPQAPTSANLPGFNAAPANGLLPNPGYAVNSKSRPTTLRLPTLDAWNLSVQQSLTPTLSFTMAYVGNKGTHTLSAGDGNNTNPNEAAITLPAQYSVTGSALTYNPAGGDCYPAGGNCVSGGIPDPAAIGKTKGGTTLVQNGTTSNSNFLRRYYGGKLAACSDPLYPVQAGVPAGACGWAQDVTYYGDNQDTHYNALQVTMTKTFTRGLSFNVNYAWQRAFDFNSGFSTWNKSVTKGRSDSIREQQVVGYGIFQLPFGRNRQFFNHANGFVNAVIGGLQLSPVVTYSSGLPFTLSPSSCPGTSGTSAPCYVNGDTKLFHPHVTGRPGANLSYYDAITIDNGGAFSTPGLDQIGNSGRNSVFGPHFFNADMALQKDFSIREKLTMQLRVDAYNAFNHINFGNPGSNIVAGGAIGGGPGIGGYSNPRQLQFSGRFQF